MIWLSRFPFHELRHDLKVNFHAIKLQFSILSFQDKNSIFKSVIEMCK